MGSPLKQRRDIIGNIANVQQANQLQRKKSVESSYGGIKLFTKKKRYGGKSSSNVSPSSWTVKCPNCQCPVRLQPPAGTFRGANLPRASSIGNTKADRAASAPARPINKQSLQNPLAAASQGSTLRDMADKGQPIQEKDPAKTSDLDVASRSKKDPQDTKGGTDDGVMLNSPKVTAGKAANDEPPKRQLPKNEMKTKPSMIKGKESTSITSTQRTISLGEKLKLD